MKESYALEKRCSICKAYKPRAEFCVKSDSSDGRLEACRQCIHDRNQREYQKRKVSQTPTHGDWLKQQIGRP